LSAKSLAPIGNLDRRGGVFIVCYTRPGPKLKVDETAAERQVMQSMDRDAREDEIIGQMTKWLIAAFIACVALLGLFALVAALVVVFELPSWVGIVVGTALAVGAAAFAWLVASALESGRRTRSSVRNEGVRQLKPRA
jgi:protein-S-isoprenylcysteine O-methyltransferase Ste14